MGKLCPLLPDPVTILEATFRQHQQSCGSGWFLWSTDGYIYLLSAMLIDYEGCSDESIATHMWLLQMACQAPSTQSRPCEDSQFASTPITLRLRGLRTQLWRIQSSVRPYSTTPVCSLGAQQWRKSPPDSHGQRHVPRHILHRQGGPTQWSSGSSLQIAV